MSRVLTITIPLTDDLEGRLAHATAILKCKDTDIVIGCFHYGMNKVQANMPLAGSMRASLEANEAGSEVLKARIKQATHVCEKALADTVALTRTMAVIVNTSTPEPESGKAARRTT